MTATSSTEKAVEGSGGKQEDSQVSGLGHQEDDGGICGPEGYRGRWKT